MVDGIDLNPLQKLVKVTMRHRRPFFLTANPIRPFNKKVSTLLVPIRIWHIRYQPQIFIPGIKMVCPLSRGDMMGPVAEK